MPVPIGALSKAGGAARGLLRRAPEGIRYAGGLVRRAGSATLQAGKAVAKSKPGKIATGSLVIGTGGYAGLTLLGAGVHNFQAGWSAPITAGVGPFEALAPGVPVEAYADEAAAAYYQAQTRDLNTPGPAEFLTSWKGIIVLAIVAVVIVMVLTRKKGR